MMKNKKVLQLKRRTGFTLIELLVVLTVAGILSAFAIDTYSGYMIRGYRAGAQASVVQAAAWMQRVRTEQGSFAPGGVAPSLPAALAQSPANGAARYTLSLSAVTGNTFTVTATPSASLATSEICGNLAIDHTGLKSFSDTRGDLRTCWGN